MNDKLNHTINILNASTDTLIGNLKDFKRNKESGNSAGCYYIARNLSNTFRDMTNRGYFRNDLKFENVKNVKTGCLWEHCLGLQSVSYKFLDMYCSEWEKIDIKETIIRFLEIFAFQICIPLSHKVIVINGKTVNKALDVFQNKHVSIFVTFEEYMKTLEEYDLKLLDEDKNKLKELFDKAERYNNI
jgi:hypothetical protein